MNYQENYYCRTLDDLGIRDQKQFFFFLAAFCSLRDPSSPRIEFRSLHWMCSLNNLTTRKVSSPNIFLKVDMEERLMTEKCIENQ